METAQKPVIIVGAGLAGLVAAYELSLRKVPVIMLDQENEKNLGGQAFWSLGGIFCVNSSSQRRVGIRDNRALALADWLNTAAFDRDKEDYWPRRWAEAFVDFATDEMESYVKARGIKFVNVGWAERGSGDAAGHGNSVPRFHLTWGTGPEVVRVFAEPVKAAAQKGLVTFKFRHRADELVLDDDNTGAVIGVRGQILEDTDAERGVDTSRKHVDKFELRGSAIIIATGGIGGNISTVRRNWPVDRLGPSIPRSFIIGVPSYVDGQMIDIAQNHGASVVNADRMWHYPEGVANWDPVWAKHGIRVIAGPSSLWLDATGKRLPAFLYPGCDTLASLKHVCATGYDYSWFILNKSIIAKEFALSGSDQNPDLTDKSLFFYLSRLFGSNGPVPVQNFMKNGADFVVRDSLEDLVVSMNQLVAKDAPQLDVENVRREIQLRDAQADNPYSKDAQMMLINNARLYWPEKYTRVVKPHRILDQRHGPLIAVKMNILTRKTLGGLETDLSSQVMRSDRRRFPGLYAAGEAAGFGGGGVHGYSALEGTFLGGCIFSGRVAGRAVADLVSVSPLLPKM